jgi:hypothetical protein
VSQAVRRRLAAALCGMLLPVTAAAQNYVARADTLFQQGRVFAAETVYYYAVRRQPRNPSARLALGRYLAARGALRVGAVLMEEARYFGGDAKTIGTYLAPVYARLGDYRALATLPGSPLSYGERLRAEWLRDNAPAVGGPDSASVPYVSADSGVFGTVALVVGGDTLEATIDASVRGIVLDTTWMRRPEVKTFASARETNWRNIAGVTLQASLGGMTMSNALTHFQALGSARQARVGFELIGVLAPTFDRGTQRLTLRQSGKLAPAFPGEHIPTLTYQSGIWLVLADGVWPISSEGARAALRGPRWTLDARRGEVIVER